MDISCPLCKRRELSILEQINVEDLKQLYKKNLALDISDELGDCKTIFYYKCQDCDLQFFYPLITGSESLYEKLMKFDWYYLEDKEEYEISKKYIKNSDKVLEIGCGNGLFTKKIDSNDYTGLELSTHAQKNAQNKGINVLNQTIEIHSRDHSNLYSIICAFQVLEHVNDPQSFLKGSIDCLKDGGLLILSVPSEDSFLKNATNNPLNLPPHHITRWSDLALENIAKLFYIELVHLEHEPLADIHIRWYSRIFFMKNVAKVFPLKIGLINNTLPFTFFSKITYIPALFYSAFLKKSERKPRGHSVLVILKKKD
jgi:SAM-dependent methyltransferase